MLAAAFYKRGGGLFELPQMRVCPSYQNNETWKLRNNTQRGHVTSLSILDVNTPVVLFLESK